MVRPTRATYPGALHHIVCRGNGDDLIFNTDGDRQRYLNTISKYKSKYVFSLYAYVLMNNHVHLLVQTRNESISKVLQAINTSYSMYFNIKNKRRGHLFQGRFYSSIVEKQPYLLEVSRYIHLNPVRAGLIDEPEKWLWSSCRCYLGLENNDLVDVEEALELLNISIGSNARKHYAIFLKDGVNKELPITVKNGLLFIGSEKYIRRITDWLL